MRYYVHYQTLDSVVTVDIHRIKVKEYLLSIFTVDCLPHIAGVGNH